MTSAALMAHGTHLHRAGTVIAEIVSISDFEYFKDEIDVTNTDSGGVYEKKPGLLGAGDVTLECNMKLADTNGQIQLATDLAAGTISAYTITGPTTNPFEWGFNAFVKSWSTITPVAESAIAKVRIVFCVTGAVTFTATASDDITTIAMGTGTLSPAWSATKYTYTVDLAASTTSTFTVTKATSTLKLYLDGVLYLTPVTTVETAAVPFSVGVTKVEITSQDSGKVPKTYTIYVSRSS